MRTSSIRWVACTVAVLALAGVMPRASSHREAPKITETPKIDGTDFYMFRSYEPGRAGFVTIIANYIGLEDAYGGPNFFMLDDAATYFINIDNDGDAVRDIAFRFKFRNKSKDQTLMVGAARIAIPLINWGRIGPDRTATENLNVIESFVVDVVRDSGRQPITNNEDATSRFLKPVDRIGDKSIRDDSNPLASVPPNDVYTTYADNHIYNVSIPGCADAGSRLFVGQRREGFVVNLAEAFDLINTNPIGPRNGEENSLADKNVTTLALEVPISRLTAGTEEVIGGWTTANKDGKQQSRLGHPLVNEVVIGLPDKDKFNASRPQDDAQFAKYVTNPTLPEIIEMLFPVTAPNKFPRTDLVQIFLTGIPGLTQPDNVVASEMLRLNTSIPPRPAGTQDSLGVLAGDNAGFPNGRRPGDDVVDIELRALMGVLLPPSDAPSGQLPYTDGALINATIGYDPETGTVSAEPNNRLFRNSFPYLMTPLSGSPNPTHATGLRP